MGLIKKVLIFQIVLGLVVTPAMAQNIAIDLVYNRMTYLSVRQEKLNELVALGEAYGEYRKDEFIQVLTDRMEKEADFYLENWQHDIRNFSYTMIDAFDAVVLRQQSVSILRDFLKEFSSRLTESHVDNVFQTNVFSIGGKQASKVRDDIKGWELIPAQTYVTEQMKPYLQGIADTLNGFGFKKMKFDKETVRLQLRQKSMDDILQQLKTMARQIVKYNFEPNSNWDRKFLNGLEFALSIPFIVWGFAYGGALCLVTFGLLCPFFCASSLKP